MLMYFRDLDPSVLLVQTCEYDYCRVVTLHGFVGRISWRWAPGKEGKAVVPGVICSGCRQQWRAEFAVEAMPTREEIAASERELAGLRRKLDEAARLQ